MQVLDAAAEVQELMMVRNCLINQQSNKPTMGIVFNGPLSAMIMTQPDTIIRPRDFNDTLTTITQRSQLPSLEARLEKNNVPYTLPVRVGTRHYVVRNGEEITLYPDNKGVLAIRVGEGYEYPAEDEIKEEPIIEQHYTGRALFSALLPEDLYYSNGDVLIQDGVLVKGVITRADVGPERNSIVHVLTMNYPVGRTVDFVTDATFVLNRYLQDYGFSIGISSCLVNDPEIDRELESEINRARTLVAGLGPQPDDPIEAEKWEEQLLAYIAGPSNKIGKRLKTKLSRDNGLNIAALSGAKGKISNVTQIAAVVGQQHIEGKRPKAQLTWGTRCSPWFAPNDDSIEAWGYCNSSFLQGLDLPGMMAHASSTREGLLGTALKTAETGFMHRKAVKTLQDAKTEYDGSVRYLKTILQYVYGDDGFAPNRLQLVNTSSGKFLSFIDMKTVTSQLNQRYGY